MKNILVSQNRLMVIASLLIIILSVISSCKKSSDSSTPSSNKVYIQDMAFTPSTITVPVNTTVKWTNKDNMSHTVTSTADLFDSGAIDFGGTYSHTFAAAGTFTYKCSYHPSMEGTVIVQ